MMRGALTVVRHISTMEDLMDGLQDLACPVLMCHSGVVRNGIRLDIH